MPGLVRIKKTKNSRIDDRLNELYSTVAPVRFECAFSARVADEAKVESAFHRIYGARVAIGQTLNGRYLRVIYLQEGLDSIFVITACALRGKPLSAYKRRRRKKQ